MQKYIWQHINEFYSMCLSWSAEEIDSEHTAITVPIYLGIYFRLTHVAEKLMYKCFFPPPLTLVLRKESNKKG